jgi:hypothetical protein
VPGLVDGDAERRDAGGLAFLERDHRVLDAVGVRATVAPVIEVLGKPVGEQKNVLRA